VVDTPATTSQPAGNLPAVTGENSYSSAGTPVNMAPETLATAGGSQPHNNMQPHLSLNLVIALQGVYPSRG
jgi:microcystin-dependent protein